MVLLEVLKFYSCQSNYPAVIQDGKNLFWPSNRILCCFDHNYLWSSHGQKECALFQKIPALSEESAGWYITHIFPIWSKKLQFSCIVQNWVNLSQFSNTSMSKVALFRSDHTTTSCSMYHEFFSCILNKLLNPNLCKYIYRTKLNWSIFPLAYQGRKTQRN